ncbi:hypothetical protein CPB84DRAFT_1462372 [Gymnopilus junonius]|uniref:Uncharacterized protein n=1 Tax=Gymnopilus junonius TaxID=109634 RepID=A0A9P5NJC7_GYMJU|nr:hypothetical protein CPB84DRAFT_1462372 [Gymnopilus junonius]
MKNALERGLKRSSEGCPEKIDCAETSFNVNFNFRYNSHGSTLCSFLLPTFHPDKALLEVNIRMSFSSPTLSLCHPDIHVPVTRRSLKNSVTFPLSSEHIHIVLNDASRALLNTIVPNPSSLEHFIFLPQTVDNMEKQRRALQFFIQQSRSNQMSFHFMSDLEHHLTNLTNLRLENLVYGGGRIDIVDEIILPNIHRLLYLDCLLSCEAHSRLRMSLPNAPLHALEDVNVTFITIGDQHSFTSIVHARYSFGHVDPPQRLPPLRLDTMSHLEPMTKIDMGSICISADAFISIMRQSRTTLTEASFFVTFAPISTLLQQQHMDPVIMRVLTDLCLRLVDTSHSPNFIHLIHLPAIISLWVDWADRNHPFKWDPALYTQWLSHSSTTLKKLVLVDLPDHNRISCRSNRPRSDYSKLEELMRSVPNIKSLSLPPGIHVALPILIDMANGGLLRHLNSFSLAVDGKTNNVVNMLRARNKAGPSSLCIPIAHSILQRHM